jgi:hypothetical protein
MTQETTEQKAEIIANKIIATLDETGFEKTVIEERKRINSRFGRNATLEDTAAVFCNLLSAMNEVCSCGAFVEFIDSESAKSFILSIKKLLAILISMFFGANVLTNELINAVSKRLQAHHRKLVKQADKMLKNPQ